MRSIIVSILGAWLFIGVVALLEASSLVAINGSLLWILQTVRDLSFRPFEWLAAVIAQLELPVEISSFERNVSFIVSFGFSYPIISLLNFVTINIGRGDSAARAGQLAASIVSFAILSVIWVILPLDIGDPRALQLITVGSLLAGTVGVIGIGLLFNLMLLVRRNTDENLQNLALEGKFLSYYFGELTKQALVALAVSLAFVIIGELKMT